MPKKKIKLQKIRIKTDKIDGIIEMDNPEEIKKIMKTRFKNYESKEETNVRKKSLCTEN